MSTTAPAGPKISPEFAAGVRDFMLMGIENEISKTMAVIAAVPDAKRDWKPDAASRSAWDLAWHLACEDVLFLDQIALFFILVPIYKPILAVYRVDEIWFFTMLLIVATVGGISPPFGYTLFAMKSALPNSSMSQLYKAAWPFVWIICSSIVIIAMFPGIATWLPNLMGR